ncbi:imelysin family protein [Flavobacterium sp. NG2]|uniref:imelysin family protein n=1 Tax=Flavobacterium sp. NG2 TaxID=3097547 RepID=UPI002A7F004D|nr:imelysin family protein [Flavobacterium sp. NG2]WPR70075.1 imelysin family protein [Flavobacterium sp. NG2]
MKKLIFLFSLITLLAACSSNEGSGDSDNYDRTALLTNWANNIIVPSYTNYQAKVQTLVTDAATFNSNPTEANLQTVRTSWLEAYKAYQYVQYFSFGKAEEIYFKERTNTYPTDVTGINANITAGSYNLSLISQTSKQGFPALDYVLNGLGTTDTEIVSYYTNTNATKYKQYLTDLVTALKSNADTIVADWNSSYKASYIANNGKSITSSVSITINSFIETFEKNTRAGKIGIPAGLFSGGTVHPEKVEGYYKKDVSKILCEVAVHAAQDFFNGKSFNNSSEGASLKSYLNFLNVVRNNQNLSDIINTQFETSFTKIGLLSNNFSNQISSDNSKMITAYDSLQQNVVYLKLDMMQALKITVDYVDNDGD